MTFQSAESFLFSRRFWAQSRKTLSLMLMFASRRALLRARKFLAGIVFVEFSEYWTIRLPVFGTLHVGRHLGRNVHGDSVNVCSVHFFMYVASRLAAP